MPYTKTPVQPPFAPIEVDANVEHQTTMLTWTNPREATAVDAGEEEVTVTGPGGTPLAPILV